MTETQLVAALQTGDQNAFADFVNQHQQLVYNTALGMLQSEEDAEDLAQDVFVQAYMSIKNFKGDAKLSTWLYRITISKCLDSIKYKKRKKRFGLIESLFGGTNETRNESSDFYHPGIALENKERSAVLFKAISNLPDNQKIAFILHKVEGLSHTEIAEIMDCTNASVEAYMHRAKQNLRKLLGDYFSKH